MKKRPKTGTAPKPAPDVTRPFDIITQTTTCTVNNIYNSGGQVLTNIEVIAVFWGSYWSSTSPAPSPTPATYYTVFTGLVTGPFMTRLRQYSGVGPGTVQGSFINDSSDPANNYSNSDVTNMLTALFGSNPAVPQPISGHTRFYAVVTPPGINNSDGGAVGEHGSFTYNGNTAWYAWVDSIGGLADTGDSLGVCNIFSHELVECATDPNLDAWHVNDSCSSGDEIADTCSNQFGIVSINGVTCNVQCYWSASDNACVIPLGDFNFLINKNTFGLDEVKDAIATNNGIFSGAFYLALDDFSIDTFNSFQVSIPNPTGPFASLSGITISPSPATPGGPTPAQPIPIYEDPSDTSSIQRIRFSFDIKFASALTTPFPSSGDQPYELTATFQTAGSTVPGANSQDTINFFLAAGEDPYFTNFDPTNSQAVSYLSQDLRVFPLTQGQSALPGAPVFQSSQTAYDYIQALLAWMNNNNTYTTPVPPASSDPLNALPNQAGYEDNITSVAPLASGGAQNYNFAIARVRLNSNVQGTSGEASNCRVFFRLWIAASYDTDFDPNTTYLSNPGYPSLPQNPLASSASLPPDPTGQPIRTQPFFATDINGTNDYNASYPTSSRSNNINTIQIPVIPGRDSIWTYYGCFLDVYNSSNNSNYPGTHHCLVAQIAYDDAPVQYSTSDTTYPGNTDKLAQRNLSIALSGNPGPLSTHRVPSTFDTSPSKPFQDASGNILQTPDEMMIDWGNTPPGSTAYIYWPQVSAASVVQLAGMLYNTNYLSVADPNTIQCATTRGVTYIPIPAAAGQTFAGLFTVDLPKGIHAGQEFKIVVRRLRTQQQIVNPAPPPPPVPQIAKSGSRAASPVSKSASTSPRAASPSPNAVQEKVLTARFVTGAFIVTIPVTTDKPLRESDENTLSILKWRLLNMSPIYRWYPVVQREIQYYSARINGAGGNAGSVPPSETGLPVSIGNLPPGTEVCYTGKVCEVIYGCFGDFEGFRLCTCDQEHLVRTREKGLVELLMRACRDRLLITVCLGEQGCDPVRKVIVHC